MASVLFCSQCGSDATDVRRFREDGATAQFHCNTCGHSADVHGFTVGRYFESDVAHVVEIAKRSRAWAQSKYLRPLWEAYKEKEE